jgi:5-(carboxyamino)imidazole ribonucleotide mutase
MPPGIPVATVAIGAGRNAGLLAVQMLAAHDATLQRKLAAFRAKLTRDARASNSALKSTP